MPRGNRARLFSIHGHVYCIWPVPYLPYVPTERTFPPYLLPLRPLPLFEASPPPFSSRVYVATARGIKYNKDIQWELIGYLRIYRSLRAALLRRGPVTARALLSFLPLLFSLSNSSPPPSSPSPTPPLAALRISPFCRPSRRVEWRYSAVE